MRHILTLAALAAGLIVPPALPAQEAPPAEPAPPPAPAAPAVKFSFNPDIAVIGNFVAFAGRSGVAEDFSDPPAMSLRESELSFQAVVDPYARAAFYLAASDDGVELEEGFLEFTRLPAGLTAKLGKFKAAFGKVNTFHPHVLPWADVPLAHAKFMGGDEGLVDSGVSVSWLAPTEALFIEATGQVLNGNDGGLFTRFERRDVAYVAHLKLYRDLNDSHNLEVGFSGAYGNGDPAMTTPRRRFGADLTWRWKPAARGNYTQFVVRNEWYAADRIDRDPLDPSLGRKTPVGAFLSADWKFARRWWTGARVDYAQDPAAGDLQDRQASLSLTFTPSEFHLWRLQARRTWDDALSRPEYSVLLQAQFSIGAHGAHPF